MILVLEDNKTQLDYLVRTIERINPKLEIKIARTIQEAKTIVKHNKIEAFFLDIQLTDGSGIEFAKQLRSVSIYHLAPIVFITGLATKELEAFRNTHCYDFIVKPFEYDKVATVVENLFMNHQPAAEELDTQHVILEFKGVKQRINLKDIIFIESRQRKIYLVTEHEEIKYKVLSLNKFTEALDGRFMQVHQSFIVNKEYIDRIVIPDSNMYLRGTNIVVPIGKSYKRKVREINELY